MVLKCLSYSWCPESKSVVVPFIVIIMMIMMMITMMLMMIMMIDDEDHELSSDHLGHRMESPGILNLKSIRGHVDKVLKTMEQRI